MENQQLVPPAQQCSSTLVSFGQEFLSNEHSENMPHLKYSPDLAPANFYLFLSLKSELKGQHFCDATDIIKNVMEELKILPQNGFQECLHCLYSCCGKCIVMQGDSFEVWGLYNCTTLYL